MKNKIFFKNKKVFITGHTGFKGSWLSILLKYLGADVCGYALKPPTEPNMFELCGLNSKIKSIIGDIRNLDFLKNAITNFNPEIIIHMAAQPLVRESYKNPVETYQTNLMGTVNILESARYCSDLKVIINVTTDKCYENKEWFWAYRENERLGGYDPYSNSKACSEMITSAYRNSFFNPEEYEKHGVAIGTCRAGNVIGGGDWAEDRLIPDCIKALLAGKDIIIRNPNSIRPWQFVLEPLTGYLTLVEDLYDNGIENSGAFNFGPDENDIQPVEWIVKKMTDLWGNNAKYKVISNPKDFHEAKFLKLDCAKAKSVLNWKPVWNIEKTIEKIIEWYQNYINKKDMYKISEEQIKQFLCDRFK